MICIGITITYTFGSFLALQRFFWEGIQKHFCYPSTRNAAMHGYPKAFGELAWRSGSVMDYHATARGSIPGGNGVTVELHVLRKGQ